MVSQAKALLEYAISQALLIEVQESKGNQKKKKKKAQQKQKM